MVNYKQLRETIKQELIGIVRNAEYIEFGKLMDTCSLVDKHSSLIRNLIVEMSLMGDDGPLEMGYFDNVKGKKMETSPILRIRGKHNE